MCVTVVGSGNTVCVCVWYRCRRWWCGGGGGKWPTARGCACRGAEQESKWGATAASLGTHTGNARAIGTAKWWKRGTTERRGGYVIVVPREKRRSVGHSYASLSRVPEREASDSDRLVRLRRGDLSARASERSVEYATRKESRPLVLPAGCATGALLFALVLFPLRMG